METKHCAKGRALKLDIITKNLVSDMRNGELFFQLPTSGHNKGTPVYIDGQCIKGAGYVGDGSDVKTIKFKASAINHFIWWVGVSRPPEDLVFLKEFVGESIKRFNSRYFSDMFRYKIVNGRDALSKLADVVVEEYVKEFTTEKMLQLVVEYTRDRLVLSKDDDAFSDKLTAKDIFVVTCTSVIVKMVEIMLSSFKWFLSNSDSSYGNLSLEKRKVKSTVVDILMSVSADVMGAFDDYCSGNTTFLDYYSSDGFNTMDNLFGHVEFKIGTTRLINVERYIDRIHIPNGTAMSDIVFECIKEVVDNIIKLRPTICYDNDISVDENMKDGLLLMKAKIDIEKKTSKTADNIHSSGTEFSEMSPYNFGREFGFNGTKVSSFLVSRISLKDNGKDGGTVQQKVYDETVKNIPNNMDGGSGDGDTSQSDILYQENVINNPAGYKRHIIEKDFILKDLFSKVNDKELLDKVVANIPYDKRNNPLAKFLLQDAISRMYNIDVFRYMTVLEIKLAMACLYLIDVELYNNGLRTAFLAEKYNTNNDITNVVSYDMINNDCNKYFKEDLDDTISRLCKTKYLIHNIDEGNTKSMGVSFVVPLRDYLLSKLNTVS